MIAARFNGPPASHVVIRVVLPTVSVAPDSIPYHAVYVFRESARPPLIEKAKLRCSDHTPRNHPRSVRCIFQLGDEPHLTNAIHAPCAYSWRRRCGVSCRAWQAGHRIVISWPLRGSWWTCAAFRYLWPVPQSAHRLLAIFRSVSRYRRQSAP